MNDVTITGMRRVINSEPNQGGSKVLAWFECEVNGFVMRGCAFVRTAKGSLVCWPPKLEKQDDRRSVVIVSEGLRQAMQRAAQAAYRALGGTDGEFAPFDEAAAIADCANAAANYAAASKRIQEKREGLTRDKVG